MQAVAVASSLLLAAGCSRNQAETRPAHGVSYLLDWKKSKVEEAAGAGWEVTNDLGYRVHVSHGYLVTRSLELIPCNPVPPPVSLLDRLDDVIGPRRAYAGHSAIADPSATKNAEVESLLSPQSHYAATLYPGAQTYCQAHYLIARADRQATGLPTEVDLVDQSLRIEGWFRQPGQAQEQSFTVVTAVANGRLFDLPRAASHEAFALDTASESGVVVVRRDLDTIFDHVDFSVMNDKRIGREVLQNLINATEIELRVNHDG
ncbi:MAG: hypothetical protein HY270_01550 [Deltaproteobacteria bacterium]|nr:hypothetical protein [Deltaproteobacteria bacterium]